MQTATLEQHEAVKKARTLRADLGTLDDLRSRRAVLVRKQAEARKNLMESRKRGMLGRAIKGSEESAAAKLAEADRAVAEVDQAIADFPWKEEATREFEQEATAEALDALGVQLVAEVRPRVRKIQDAFAVICAEVEALKAQEAVFHRYFVEGSLAGGRYANRASLMKALGRARQGGSLAGFAGTLSLLQKNHRDIFSLRKWFDTVVRDSYLFD